MQQEVQAGDPVPKEGEYVRLPFAKAQDIIRNGYNRWSHSAYRQWLNSDADKGEWWTAQHDGDMPPQELPNQDGFMKGLDPAFLAVVKPIQVITYKNTVTDDGEAEITNDRFFLASNEEMYGSPNLAGEGEAWQYWKEATGFDEPKNDACPGRIYYDMRNHNSAQGARLRSAYRGGSFDTWSVYTSGFLYGAWSASVASRCAPACAIY